MTPAPHGYVTQGQWAVSATCWNYDGEPKARLSVSRFKDRRRGDHDGRLFVGTNAREQCQAFKIAHGYVTPYIRSGADDIDQMTAAELIAELAAP